MYMVIDALQPDRALSFPGVSCNRATREYFGERVAESDSACELSERGGRQTFLVVLCSETAETFGFDIRSQWSTVTVTGTFPKHVTCSATCCTKGRSKLVHSDADVKATCGHCQALLKCLEFKPMEDTNEWAESDSDRESSCDGLFDLFGAFPVSLTDLCYFNRDESVLN